MASLNLKSNNGIRSKPWKARVKVDWVEYYLGHYATKEEAEQVEAEFRASN